MSLIGSFRSPLFRFRTFSFPPSVAAFGLLPPYGSQAQAFPFGTNKVSITCFRYPLSKRGAVQSSTKYLRDHLGFPLERRAKAQGFSNTLQSSTKPASVAGIQTPDPSRPATLLRQPAIRGGDISCSLFNKRLRLTPLYRHHLSDRGKLHAS